jgi:hypothetical protein
MRGPPVTKGEMSETKRRKNKRKEKKYEEGMGKRVPSETNVVVTYTFPW